MNSFPDTVIGDIDVKRHPHPENPDLIKYWESLSDIVLQIDAGTGDIDVCSPSVKGVTGFSVEAVTGRHILDFVHPEEASLISDAVVNWPRESKSSTHTFRCLMVDGSYFWAEACGSKIEQGSTVKFLISLRNISNRKKLEQRLIQLAKTDSLSGLFNRYALMEHLQEKCLEGGKSFSVYLLDLDKFKHINDTYGHQYGDDLLVEIARRLRMSVRQTDIVARIGGDEFVIVTPMELSEGNASRLAHKILDAVAQPVEINGVIFHPRTSIGISQYPLHCENAIDLLMYADKAMYQAKKQKCGFIVYGSEPNDYEGIHTLGIERVLYQALPQQRVQVYLQPIMDCKTLQIVGAEALLRLKNMQGEYVSPSEFIPVAEESGMIVDLGNFVIEEVLSILVLNPNLKISINVSGRQMNDTQFLTHLTARLKHYGVDGSQLEIELTESIFMENSAKLVQALENLTELGITLSIDDFGTGYSSLSYLRYLPISKIKIDRSFISEMPTNVRDTELVQALVQMSRPLGLQVTAEGVETLEQSQVLANIGCHFSQGYCHYRPMPIEDFLKLWNNVSSNQNKELA